MGCTRQQLHAFFDDLLTPQRFKDYCPNGLQVEGKTDVRHLVSGVTASQALIEAARDRGAHAILVHHGYFWRSEPPCITGMKAARLRALRLRRPSILSICASSFIMICLVWPVDELIVKCRLIGQRFVDPDGNFHIGRPHRVCLLIIMSVEQSAQLGHFIAACRA